MRIVSSRTTSAYPRWLARGVVLLAIAAVLSASLMSATVSAHAPPPGDPLHGGQGLGVTVLGHTDLGGAGLNGHVATLGKLAFVGAGTNGGFAAQWNKTPTCRNSASPVATVKVVDVNDTANPTVVSTINVDTPTGPAKTLPRDLTAIDVEAISPANVFTGKLLAVALERCNQSGLGQAGVNLYNVNNPAAPLLLGRTMRFDPAQNRFSAATRQVSVVQRADGKVLMAEANQQGGNFGGGIHLVDITNPAVPVDVGSFSFPSTIASPIQECRPFVLPQGVSLNESGTKAYASYQDEGMLVLDISNPTPGSTLPVISQKKYDPSEEGNTFRFVPRGEEDRAVVTDDDVNPARSRLTIAPGSTPATFTEPGGTAPGVFRACEAIWGAGAPSTGPLFRRTNPTVTSEIKFITGGGCRATNYTGTDVTGKIVMVDRGGTLIDGTICGFDNKAQFAQSFGAAGLLIANTLLDHHGGAAGFLFSPDSTATVDAGITIPIYFMTKESRDSIRSAIIAGETVSGTMADTADTWGALRVFDLTGPTPTQTAVFNAPHTNVLTPGGGLFQAVNPIWKGHDAIVAWMSDGMRVVDVQNTSSPQGRAFYIPPAVADPTGNYPTVPLVVDVARLNDSVYLVSDINGGLYVVKVAMKVGECSQHANQAACVAMFAASSAQSAPPAGPPSSSTVITDTSTQSTTD